MTDTLPIDRLAAVLERLRQKGVVDMKFAWKPGVLEGNTIGGIKEDVATFIERYLETAVSAQQAELEDECCPENWYIEEEDYDTYFVSDGLKFYKED